MAALGMFVLITRRCSPSKFVPQCLIVTSTWDLDEAESHRRSANDHAVVMGKFHDFLSVDNEPGPVSCPANGNRVRFVRRLDHGAGRKSMRANGSDHEGGQFLPQNWPSG